MQIAQIVPKVLTQKKDIFDYAIGPEILPFVKIGTLVEVPFHGRNVWGIVINLKKRSGFEKLKSIERVIDPVPAVDATRIKLAQWMADYYLTPLSKTLFEMIVPPAIRAIKKIDDQDLLDTSPIVPANTTQKFLVIGDFLQRFKFYQQAITKTINKNKNVIFLVPDLSLIRFLDFSLLKLKDTDIAIIHANLTKTERWTVFNNVRKNKVKIIIGSQSALFAPVRNLGLIIIDQEENDTYKNDRSPRYHALTVAQQLCSLTGSHLVVGSLTPRVETFYKTLNQSFKLKKYPSKIKQHASRQITTVDLNNSRHIISPTLQSSIEATLLKKQKILLLLNRKGEGRSFVCLDCGWIATCPTCALPLIPEKNKLMCFKCDKKFDQPDSCPKCRNVHLKAKGMGTNRIEKFVSDYWPQAKIMRLDKDIDEKRNLQQQINSADIIIATSYGLKFRFPSMGLVGIVDADQGFNFPDYKSAEHNFEIFYKFLKIGQRGIIQTRLSENPTIKALADLNYEKFFLNEIETRKIFKFPPYTRLIRLLFQNTDMNMAIDASHRFYEQLIKKNFFNLEISPPNQCFFQKIRTKFRYQIIIKIPNNVKQTDYLNFQTFLKSSVTPIIVDVDPKDLL